MALIGLPIRDANDAVVQVATSDLLGGAVVTNAFHIISGSAEVGDTNPLPVRSGSTKLVGTFARPANTSNGTSYAVGDVVSASTDANTTLTLTNAARANGGSGYIVAATIETDQKSVTPVFRVHLFSDDVACAGDNLPHFETFSDNANKIRSFVLGPMSTPTDTATSSVSSASDSTLRHFFTCHASSRDLVVVLETLSAYTPASLAQYRLTLWIEQL